MLLTVIAGSSVLFSASRYYLSSEDVVATDIFLVKSSDDLTFVSRLPSLNELKWPAISVSPFPTGRKFPNGTLAPLPAAFEPVMSAGQRNLSIKLLNLFSQIMVLNGMADKFFLYGATLLGSFRHHDYVPWDDDVDVVVDISVRPQVQALLNELAPNYLLVTQAKRDKFCTRLLNETNGELDDVELSRHTSQYSWGWPYIDISYYSHNDTHVTDIAWSYGREYSFPTSVVFPLQYRPFGKHWYPAPYDTLQFLKITYGFGSLCKASGYSHVVEGAGPSASMHCSELASRYPFVEHGLCPHRTRRFSNNIVWGIEHLVIKSAQGKRKIIHSVCLPVPANNMNAITYGLGYHI